MNKIKVNPRSYCFSLILMIGGMMVGFSQEKTVEGKVTDENGLPLPGATVVEQGTDNGTTTDFEGNYKISVENDATLVFSYVGYQTSELEVQGNNQIDLSLNTDSQLDEVIVTAMGIRRNKRALGYSVSNLQSDAVEQRPEADIARVLSGKIAGVNVVGTGGIAGSGTNITIRGAVSITGNNQPLFVVNGIPFNSSTDNQSNTTTGNGSVSASSRFLDIDPNNITSISVLKGLSASVLYGNAGRNGVILITTKTGNNEVREKGFGINISQSLFYNQIANLPDYQNIYGQGGDNTVNVGYVGNWGGRFDNNLTVRHHYNLSRLAKVFPEYQGKQVSYQAFPNNVKNFFRAGLGKTTSINISKASEDVSFNLNFGNTDEQGYVHGNNFSRSNFGMGGSVKLTNKFSFNGSFNYTTSNFKTPPIAADNGTGNFSVFQRTLFVPRNLDLSLPFQNPITGASVYYRTDQENPNWLIHNAQESVSADRFFNSINAQYDFNDNFSLLYRVGLDRYTENQQFFINKGGVRQLIAQQGYLKTTAGTNTIWDHSFILNIQNLFISNNLSLNGTLGLNANSEHYKKTGLVSTGQVVFNFIDHNNFTTQSNRDPLGSSLDFEKTINTLGAYLQLELDYNNYLFVTLSGRNDWSSTVEEVNRSLFYPSASVAWIPTTLYPQLKSDFISFIKLRIGYGTSAGFPTPYRTRATLPQATAAFTSRNGTVLNTNSNNSIYPNPDLKPELHSEIEAGIEANFWNDRIDLEVSAYNKDSQDQILIKRLDNSTGFSQTFINAGKIQTQGLEIDLGIRPLSLQSPLKWNSQFVFNTYKNKVLELPGKIVDGKKETDEIFIAGFSNLGNYAIEGKPLGVIKGSYALRDSDGNYLINPQNGNIIDSDAVGKDDKIIGDPNPDYKLTSINSIHYKGFTLSAQLEYTKGGDISSNLINNLLRRGVTKDTEDREGTYVIKGFLADPDTGDKLLDGDGNGIPNTIQLGANEIYFLNFLDPSDQGIYDGTVVRLREIALSYQLPDKLLDKLPFANVVLTLNGQNLWYHAPNVPKYTNYDPELISTGVGNGMGLEFNTAPSSKKYGLTIKATF